MLSFRVPWAPNCIIDIYRVFLDVRFPIIPGCDFRGMLSPVVICPCPALGALHSWPSQGKEESQPVLEMAWVKLLPCIGPGLIPELSLHGPEEAGAGGMVSKRAEGNYICFLMCSWGNGSSCSPRCSKALLGEPNQTGCEEGGHIDGSH